ncbi:hypothetical protein [Streptomyces sp. NBC_01276]|uniref:hypothetical protein n=1 Tax=Streptomyces sp. NBC_01276 TaxID=2903808 RepID=UPI00352EA8F1
MSRPPLLVSSSSPRKAEGMVWMRKMIRAVTVVMMVGTVGACQGGGSANGSYRHTPSREAETSAAVPRLTVPDGFDVAKGWALPSGSRVKTAVAPTTQLVIISAKEPNGYVLTAKDARTGAVRWSTQPWWPFESVRDEAPEPQVVTVGGKDYATISIAGRPGEDSVHKGQPTIQTAVYPADASGTGVRPARTMDLPVSAIGQTRLPWVSGTRLIYHEEGTGSATVLPVSMDVVSGKVTRYTQSIYDAPAPSVCGSCHLGGHQPGLTPQGPLIQGMQGPQTTSFWVPGAWYGADNMPPGAFAGSTAEDLQIVDDLIIAGWPADDDTAFTSRPNRVWAVHDATTGKVKASVTCATDSPAGTNARDPFHPAVDADHRYLVYGPLAFDLAGGRGTCAIGSSTTKDAAFVSVDRNGTAYGHTTTQGGEQAPVTLAIASGNVTALPSGTKIPTVLLNGAAVYIASDEDDDEAPYKVVSYPRR